MVFHFCVYLHCFTNGDSNRVGTHLLTSTTSSLVRPSPMCNKGLLSSFYNSEYTGSKYQVPSYGNPLGHLVPDSESKSFVRSRSRIFDTGKQTITYRQFHSYENFKNVQKFFSFLLGNTV